MQVVAVLEGVARLICWHSSLILPFGNFFNIEGLECCTIMSKVPFLQKVRSSVCFPAEFPLNDLV